MLFSHEIGAATTTQTTATSYLHASNLLLPSFFSPLCLFFSLPRVLHNSFPPRLIMLPSQQDDPRFRRGRRDHPEDPEDDPEFHRPSKAELEKRVRE
jgi:hypothetical protein